MTHDDLLESQIKAMHTRWPKLNLKITKDKRAKTLGYTIRLPKDWSDRSPGRKYRLLKHEEQHIIQQEAEGNDDANRGLKTYLYKYVFRPVPMFRARYRYGWEREGHLAGLLARVETDGLDSAMSRVRPYAEKICGKPYWWPSLDVKGCEQWLEEQLLKHAVWSKEEIDAAREEAERIRKQIGWE